MRPFFHIPKHAAQHYWVCIFFIIYSAYDETMLGIILAVTLSIPSIPVDKAAHFGVSWAANHVTHELCTAIDKETKIPCLFLSSAATLTAGLIWENNGNNDIQDMAADALGIIGSNILIVWKW